MKNPGNTNRDWGSIPKERKGWELTHWFQFLFSIIRLLVLYFYFTFKIPGPPVPHHSSTLHFSIFMLSEPVFAEPLLFYIYFMFIFIYFKVFYFFRFVFIYTFYFFWTLVRIPYTHTFFVFICQVYLFTPSAFLFVAAISFYFAIVMLPLVVGLCLWPGLTSGLCLWPVPLTCAAGLCLRPQAVPQCLWPVPLACVSGLCHWPVPLACAAGQSRWPVPLASAAGQCRWPVPLAGLCLWAVSLDFTSGLCRWPFILAFAFYFLPLARLPPLIWLSRAL